MDRGMSGELRLTRGCRGKVQYNGKIVADRVIPDVRLKCILRGDKRDLVSYRCNECAWWHIGHVNVKWHPSMDRKTRLGLQ